MTPPSPFHDRARSRAASCIAGAVAIACSLAAARAVAAPAPAAPTTAKASAAPSPPEAPAAPAQPTTRPPTIVLEAHVGERSSTLTAIIGPVLDELERRGFVARPSSVVKLLGGRAPRPGILDGGKTAAEIAQQVESGFDAFTQGRYKDAAAALALAVHQIKRNPALLVLDAANARSAFHAFVGLALSQAKLGYASESVETMTELLRSFSTQTVGRTEYGPQAEQFYRTVQKQTRAMGRGRLAITAGDSRAMIFVDGELHGMGRAALADLIPGIYRVFIQVPGTAGRQYEAEVRADEDRKLDVDWQVDSALTISVPWVGLVFANEAARAKESAWATTLARRWGHDTIVIVGTARLDGRPAVIATMYRASGEVVRSARVVPSGGDEARLRALARFIADGTPSKELERAIGVVIAHSVAAPPAAAREATPRASRVPLPTKLCIGGGAAAVTAGLVLLAVDQAPGPNRHFYRNTAPAGVAVGLTGLASVGVGLWWWRHQRHESSAPAVSLGPSHASIGWAGSF